MSCHSIPLLVRPNIAPSWTLERPEFPRKAWRIFSLVLSPAFFLGFSWGLFLASSPVFFPVLVSDSRGDVSYPTCDHRILPKGTAYCTDIGMTGPYDSVIGVEKDIIIKRFVDGLPAKFETSRA